MTKFSQAQGGQRNEQTAWKNIHANDVPKAS